MAKISISEILSDIPTVIDDEQKIEALIAVYNASGKNPSDLMGLLSGILIALGPLADTVKIQAES